MRYLLVLLTLALLTFESCLSARRANPVIVGALTLKATLNGIGFRAVFTGDDNDNATATLRFKRRRTRHGAPAIRPLWTGGRR